MGMQPWNQIMATMAMPTAEQGKNLTANFERWRSPETQRLNIRSLILPLTASGS